jgi:hypothetical protein
MQLRREMRGTTKELLELCAQAEKLMEGERQDGAFAEN